MRDVATGAPYQSYLEEHVQRLDLSVPDASFDFPQSFYEHRLFFLGEAHGAQTALMLDLAMIRHLRQEAGVRHLMAELDFSQAERFNAYMDSGAESLVVPVFEAWLERSMQWGNQQHFEKLRQLRELNLSLPASERVRFFGVDQIQDFDLAVDWLERRLDDLSDEATPGLAELRSAVLAYAGDQEALGVEVEAALTRIADLSPAGNAAGLNLTEAMNLKAVTHLARNLVRSAEGAGRYEMIQSNIRHMVEDFGIGDDEKLYGFWGLFHVLKSLVNETAEPLAMRLADSDLPFADEIVSVAMVYSNSRQNMPSSMLPQSMRPETPFFSATMSQDNPYLMYIAGIRDLKKVAGEAKAAVFRLDAPGSPFLGSTRLSEQSGILSKIFRFEVSPTDTVFVEYALLVRDSPALTAFEGP
ncbi:MAG: erythromycin esterase family protein [Acidobacteriota bacterium]